MSQIPNPYAPSLGLVPTPKPQQPVTPEQLEHRYLYHPPKGDQGDRYQYVRTKICTLAKDLVRITPLSVEQSLALNALDEAMFLFNAAIARNE